MPFIGGRYYANPLVGKAVEAAREAEAALRTLKEKTGRNVGPEAGGDDSSDMDAGDPSSAAAGGYASAEMKAPIHRVEIEAAEMVPSHSGRAQRGFVARVHREGIPAAGGASDASSAGAGNAWHAPQPGQLPSRGYAPKAETHVFAGHGDLLDFLKNELQPLAAKS
ncbi:MAG TPA: hypothetical protein VGD60_02745 [Candidatus Acidoferrales bacterium]